MLFSIIIPTYNRATFIAKTLESVINQTYTNWEIIIVDDGSKDDTFKVVKPFVEQWNNKIHYFYQENGERAKARNKGMQEAKGNYITFLDSDDVLYENYLQEGMNIIQKHQNPPFVHIGYEIIDTKTKKSSHQVNFLKDDDIDCLITGNPLSCMGIFLEKNLVTKFQFQENRELAGSEDWELWVRIMANVGIKVSNKICASLINHESRSVLNHSEEKLEIRKNLFFQYAFEDEAVQKKFKKSYKKMVAYMDSYIALHLILSKKKLAGWRYWAKAFFNYPLCIFERRFLASIKHTFKV